MGQDGAAAGEIRRPRILFVDDEPLVLRSLRRTLAARGLPWELQFADTGEQALEMAGRDPIDVIVSDMHMPKMDGATLLGRVQERHPGVVRMVLSGHTDPKLVFRVVPVAHQFLTKPFETAVLAAAIERALEFRKVIGSPALQALVGGDSKLPMAPKAYSALTRVLAREDASISDVVAVVERDAGLAARVAQLASSAFFRVPRTITGLAGYVSYLGVEIIKTLVLTVEIVDMFGARKAAPPGFSIDALERHAAAVGHIARRIVTRRELAEDAFLSGILHDVGRLVLASRMPDAFAKATAAGGGSGPAMLAAEFEQFGATHAEIGGYLLGIWGLPLEVVDGVLGHHQPGRIAGKEVDVGAAVHLGNVLARNPDAPVSRDAPGGLDADVVERLGGAAGLERWREIAREVVRGTAA
jgi:HD-like signal output (HDOD) protein/CheY-like chemotaxis protein